MTVSDKSICLLEDLGNSFERVRKNPLCILLESEPKGRFSSARRGCRGRGETAVAHLQKVNQHSGVAIPEIDFWCTWACLQAWHYKKIWSWQLLRLLLNSVRSINSKVTKCSVSAMFHTTALYMQGHPSALKGDDIPDHLDYYLYHQSLFKKKEKKFIFISLRFKHVLDK